MSVLFLFGMVVDSFEVADSLSVVIYYKRY